MAKDTAKKNIKSNTTRLRTFLIITVAVNLIWSVYAIFFYTSTSSGQDANDDENNSNPSENSSVVGLSFFQFLFQLSFWLSQELVAYRLIYNAGQPTYDSAGNLQSCIDLADPEQLDWLSYMQDLMWTCWALQLLTIFVSAKFWYLYWLVPIFAAYKIFVTVIKPLMAMSGVGGQQQQQQQQQDGKSAGDLPQDAKSRLNRKRQELRNAGGGNNQRR